MAVFGFVKFRVCLKKANISFEPEFGNTRFETPEKHNVFNFKLTYFSAIVDFIIWFCTSLMFNPSETFGILQRKIVIHFIYFLNPYLKTDSANFLILSYRI